MPVPSAISDLSTTPASNSPAGSETPSSTDDYLRTQASFIKQLASEAHIWCGAATGTANALVLTPSSAITSYTAGKTFHFQAASNNSGATSVSVSGLGAIDVEVNGVACAGGEILAGKWYRLLLSSATKAQLSSIGMSGAKSGANSDITSLSGLTTPLSIAQGGTGSTTGVSGIPVGAVIDFTGTSAPTGYLACPVSATNISRATYAALFAAIGTTWGAGDGSTTFGMPWFPADYVASQANGNVGTQTTGDNKTHTHAATQASHSHSLPVGNTNNPYSSGSFEHLIVAYSGYSSGVTSSATPSITVNATGGSANLAAGVRLLKCVKY